MPTYDYRCNACGHEFEHFQSMSSPVLRKCPKCGKTKLERLIGAGGGLLFKGSGFYITDYRPSSYHDAAKKDASPSTGDSKPESGKTDSGKPASGSTSEKGGAKPSTPAPSKGAGGSSSSSPAPRSKKGKSS